MPTPIWRLGGTLHPVAGDKIGLGLLQHKSIEGHLPAGIRQLEGKLAGVDLLERGSLMGKGLVALNLDLQRHRVGPVLLEPINNERSNLRLAPVVDSG